MQWKNPIWIGGGFNLPDIHWEVKPINNYQYPKQPKERFVDLADNCSMEQVVNFPIRKQNTLDLLITNRPSFIKKCILVPGFGDRDSESYPIWFDTHRLQNPSKETFTTGTELT